MKLGSALINMTKAFFKFVFFLIFAIIIISIIDGRDVYEVTSKSHLRQHFIYKKTDGKNEISRIETIRGDDQGGEPAKPKLTLKDNEFVKRVTDTYEVTALNIDVPQDFYTYRTDERREMDKFKVGMRVTVTPMDSVPYEAQNMKPYDQESQH